MKRYLLISIVCFTIAVATLFFMSCASTAPKPFHKVVHIKDLYVHIISDRSQFDYKPYRDPAKGVAGYAKRNPNEIWILGYEYKGQYYPYRLESLGHELGHTLRFNDPEILDPHEYKFYMK